MQVGRPSAKIKYFLIFLYGMGISSIIVAIIFGNSILSFYCYISEMRSLMVDAMGLHSLVLVFSSNPEENGGFFTWFAQWLQFLEKTKPAEFLPLYVLIACLIVIGIALIVMGAVLQKVYHEKYKIPAGDDQIKDIKFTIQSSQIRYLKEIIVQTPYYSSMMLIFILSLMPILLIEFPLTENYPFLCYYGSLSIYIFLTSLAAFTLPVMTLKHKYENAHDSLITNKKANFSFAYVFLMYLLAILYLLPLLIIFIMITDLSFGGFGFGVGCFIGFISSIFYLEGSFRRIEKDGCLLYVPIFKNNIILTGIMPTDYKLPAFFIFKIRGKKFEGIKKEWGLMLWLMWVIPISQLSLYYVFFCKYLVLEIYYAIYIVICIGLFIIPFKKIQKFNWVLKELHARSNEIHPRYIKSP